jgi:hypothetical protein
MNGLMLRSCDLEGCEILTLGSFCAKHEAPGDPTGFPRGRPFPAEDLNAYPTTDSTDLIGLTAHGQTGPTIQKA